ncbi:hypothetical protein AMTRI_Chr13g121080 [Amborella trichopoda]
MLLLASSRRSFSLPGMVRSAYPSISPMTPVIGLGPQTCFPPDDKSRALPMSILEGAILVALFTTEDKVCLVTGFETMTSFAKVKRERENWTSVSLCEVEESTGEWSLLHSFLVRVVYYTIGNSEGLCIVVQFWGLTLWLFSRLTEPSP